MTTIATYECLIPDIDSIEYYQQLKIINRSKVQKGYSEALVFDDCFFADDIPEDGEDNIVTSNSSADFAKRNRKGDRHTQYKLKRQGKIIKVVVDSF